MYQGSQPNRKSISISAVWLQFWRVQFSLIRKPFEEHISTVESVIVDTCDDNVCTVIPMMAGEAVQPPVNMSRVDNQSTRVWLRILHSSSTSRTATQWKKNLILKRTYKSIFIKHSTETELKPVRFGKASPLEQSSTHSSWTVMDSAEWTMLKSFHPFWIKKTKSPSIYRKDTLRLVDGQSKNRNRILTPLAERIRKWMTDSGNIHEISILQIVINFNLWTVKWPAIVWVPAFRYKIAHFQ